MSGVAGNGSDIAVVELLACGHSVREVAEQTGVSERTVYRRLADDDFRQRVEDMRREAWAAAVRRLQGIAAEAVSTIALLLTEGASGKKGAGTRLRAAERALGLAHELGESRELHERLDKVEATMGLTSGGRQRLRGVS
jgi:AcrR family transcriptional regulator